LKRIEVLWGPRAFWVVLALMLVANVVWALVGGSARAVATRSGGRLSVTADETGLARAAVDFMDAAADGDLRKVAGLLPEGEARLLIEYDLLRNRDLFTSGGNYRIYDRGESNGLRLLRVHIESPSGKWINLEMQWRRADAGWKVAALQLPDPWSYDGGTTGAPNGGAFIRIPKSAGAATAKKIRTRMESEEFRRAVITDAGLDGLVSPALLRRMYATGFGNWSEDVFLVQCSFSAGRMWPSHFARAHLAGSLIESALESRARTEAALAVLRCRKGPSRAERLQAIERLFKQGHDDVTLEFLREESARSTGKWKLFIEALTRILKAEKLPLEICIRLRAYRGCLTFERDRLLGCSFRPAAYHGQVIARVEDELKAAGVDLGKYPSQGRFRNVRETIFRRVVSKHGMEMD
jgi:hypothetical protein